MVAMTFMFGGQRRVGRDEFGVRGELFDRVLDAVGAVDDLGEGREIHQTPLDDALVAVVLVDPLRGGFAVRVARVVGVDEVLGVVVVEHLGVADDLDPGVLRLLGHVDKGLRVDGADDDRVDPLLDEVLDLGDLRRGVALGVDVVDRQIVLGAVALRLLHQLRPHRVGEVGEGDADRERIFRSRGGAAVRR
jgi:hypothetical protein